MLSSFIGYVNDAVELAQLGMELIQKLSVLLLLAYDDDDYYFTAFVSVGLGRSVRSFKSV